MSMNQFEAAGDMADWPKNEPSKPTQAAVFGVYHPKKGKVIEILWTGQFPDLAPAQYWAAKKELEAVRKGKWMMASRVLWQHDLTPEQAVEVVKKKMMPQIDRALGAVSTGRPPDIGPGPMRPINPADGERYVEITDRGGKTLGSFIVPPESRDPAAPAADGPGGFIPNDPRDE